MTQCFPDSHIISLDSSPLVFPLDYISAFMELGVCFCLGCDRSTVGEYFGSLQWSLFQIAVLHRNGMDLTEAEDTQKRWQEYTEELYKKDLHDPDNHDDVITDLEPDILEYEVKWTLESITTNKASGGDGIPVELFQILKDDAVKVLHSICQQIWKTQQWPQDWKKSLFIPIPKKVMPKNAQTTTQLHSSHMLVK